MTKPDYQKLAAEQIRAQYGEFDGVGNLIAERALTLEQAAKIANVREILGACTMCAGAGEYQQEDMETGERSMGECWPCKDILTALGK